jgi:ATP-dependent RNA helicase RhlE
MIFAELGLSESLLKAVVGEGYSTPTPVQEQSIPHVLAGRDVLASAQTGTGKTAAFALPMLHRLSEERPAGRRSQVVRGLVLAPTRELACQIHDSFRVYGRHLGLRSTVVMGGVGMEPQIRAMQRGVDIVIATPGRLVDLINQGFAKLATVETLVLDEADRMLDMGFLPDLKRVINCLPKERQTVMFSATLPPAIAELAAGILRDPVRVRIAAVQSTTALIDHAVCFVPQDQKARLLTGMLNAEATGRVIVFTRTKRGADRVAEQLNRSGLRAEAMHGNKSQGARRRILDSFKSSRPPVLVATDLAARGIDVDDVSHVFNFDLPDEPETYVHRIGRTGRAGATGKAMSFCSGGERGQLNAIERLMQRKLPVHRDTLLATLPPALKPLTPEPVENRGGRPRGGRPFARNGAKPGNFGAKRTNSRRAPSL